MQSRKEENLWRKLKNSENAIYLFLSLDSLLFDQNKSRTQSYDSRVPLFADHTSAHLTLLLNIDLKMFSRKGTALAISRENFNPRNRPSRFECLVT